MGYSRVFKPERYTPISSLLEQMQDAEVGDLITLRGLEANEANKVAFLIHDWLSHQDALRKAFRVVNLGNIIQVHKQKIRFDDVEVLRAPLKPELEDILRGMIGLYDTREEAEYGLRKGHPKLSDKERERILKEWVRIME